MHGKKYIGYSVEDLLHDQDFVSAVLKYPTDGEWEQFLEFHSESVTNMNKARELVNLFKVNEEHIPEDRKFTLWKEIRSFDKEHARKNKTFRLKRIIQVAASIIILFSIGSIAYLSFNQQKSFYQFSESSFELTSEYPVLKLENGNKIVLDKDNSEVKFLKDKNAIVINNEKIIKIQPLINQQQNQNLNEIIVPFGKKLSLVLSDGTKVRLNAGSHFAFPQKFKEKKRAVILDGEGYFEVAKNLDQAFHVSTTNVEIEVLGTKFNLSAYSSDEFYETVLLEGSVNIWDNNKMLKSKTLMVPNQKTLYSKSEEELITEEVQNPEMYMSWIEDWYQFSREDLSQVLKKIERHYDLTFSYDQENISKALPISGKLDFKMPIDEVLKILSAVAKIEYKIASDDLIIIK